MLGAGRLVGIVPMISLFHTVSKLQNAPAQYGLELEQPVLAACSEPQLVAAAGCQELVIG